MSAIPSIAMTFPNGITDHLILNQHNDECNYLGHLEKDQDVCVAMTGCLGQDHVEFTILSRTFENPHFLWHKDGSVEQLRTVNEVCNMNFSLDLLFSEYNFKLALWVRVKIYRDR